MPLDTRQWDLPLRLNPQRACFEDIAARSVHPGIPEFQARCLQPPPFQSLPCSNDKESFGKRFSLSEMRSWCAAATATTPHGGVLESSQKRLMIFDQSGNQTRLLRCPFPLQFPSPCTAAEPVKLSELNSLEKAFKEEEFDKNKESEMHEDTEEINALLYSDDDYDDDDDCESDDEVMSTGHSPYPLEQVCNKRESEEIDSPCKRQKLLDKVNNSSSLMGTKSSPKLPESNISTKEDTGSGLSNDQSKRDKIRTALKILESVVPGAKGNEALLLLDEAIDYLKLLKQDLIKNQSQVTNLCLLKRQHGEQEIHKTDKA